MGVEGFLEGWRRVGLYHIWMQ